MYGVWKKFIVKGQTDVAYQVNISGKNRFLHLISISKLNFVAIIIIYRTHTGEKPHECTVCDQAFATWKSLKSHLRRHSGDEIPNKCNVCGNVYGNEKQLEKHRRQFDHQLSAN